VPESSAYRQEQPELSAVLSTRELEVLEGATLGLTNLEIAGRLNVSVHAVKFHLASVYRKLGVANRTEAAVVCLRAGALGFRDGRKADGHTALDLDGVKGRDT
jgi:two-component system nitrate/nitrite response regulator NarL